MEFVYNNKKLGDIQKIVLKDNSYITWSPPTFNNNYIELSFVPKNLSGAKSAGNNMYYGTNSSGEVGFYTISSKSNAYFPQGW